jgi:hypothetical protein
VKERNCVWLRSASAASAASAALARLGERSLVSVDVVVDVVGGARALRVRVRALAPRHSELRL